MVFKFMRETVALFSTVMLKTMRDEFFNFKIMDRQEAQSILNGADLKDLLKHENPYIDSIVKNAYEFLNSSK